MNLTAGLGIALLPLLTIAVRGVILLFVLPAILLLAVAVPLAAIGAVIACPRTCWRAWLRRPRRRTVSPAARLVASVAAVSQKER